MSKLLTLDKERAGEILVKAVDFATDPSVENDIAELIEASKEIEVILKQVQAAFKVKLPELDLDSVEGDVIKVTISPSGSRYKIVDEQIVHPSLLKVDMDTKAVNAFVEEKGTLPQGIDYNPARGVACRITVKGGVHA